MTKHQEIPMLSSLVFHFLTGGKKKKKKKLKSWSGKSITRCIRPVTCSLPSQAKYKLKMEIWLRFIHSEKPACLVKSDSGDCCKNSLSCTMYFSINCIVNSINFINCIVVSPSHATFKVLLYIKKTEKETRIKQKLQMPEVFTSFTHLHQILS